MTNLKKYFSDIPRELLWLAYALAFFAMAGAGLSLVVFLASALQNGLFSRPLCFTNNCVEEFFRDHSQSLLILKSTVDISVAAATVGGIFVALLSYLITAKNSALTNHIEHLKIFREYLASEIEKRHLINSEKIDGLMLYETIFDQSRSGRTSVSEVYIKFILSINEIIVESNGKCVVGTVGGFSYKEHQRKIKDRLKHAGIDMEFLPRNDFFEAERQIFSLLERIGQSFCNPGQVPKIEYRSYY